ncbi:hypothetical protein [Aquimarina sp. AU58]|uniref:hypothetical protein n=1 Tax=Aquimarina sp. AU58 TaxID=1874112 RepID=UPI00135CF114|nr:hypothetical protein [Aquimarina sp. AU58]
MLNKIKSLNEVETLSKVQQKIIQGGHIPTVSQFCTNPILWLSRYPFLANDPAYQC